ncbi:MAG: aldolase/citrate lyase family protein [Planctomycetota bacterium]
MRRSRIKAKLARNEPVLLPLLNLADPAVFEMVSVLGFDGIWLDLEHMGRGVETAHDLIRAARVGGADVMARPAKGEFMRMGRLLEAGAQGILYPRCDDAAEAAEVVQWAKFPPVGKRGLSGSGPDMPYCLMDMGRYVEVANAETFIAIQIEDRHAVDRAGEIAGVEGVDVLFLGPGDFTLSEGIIGQFDHPIFQRAIERIAEAASAAGKHWGTLAMSVEMAQQLVEMEARLICYGEDYEVLRAGYRGIQEQFARFGFTFHRPLGEAEGSVIL